MTWIGSVAVLITFGYVLMFGILLSNLIYLRRGRQHEKLDSEPFVSILIPARNEEENLRRLLKSIVDQDYEPLEVIVFDDESTDGTWEVIQSHAVDGFIGIRGSELPDGWVGKVYALDQAARRASGSRLLFIDADTEFRAPGALRTIVTSYENLPPKSVLTALPRLQGGGKLLVSLVPTTILGALPWALIRPTMRAIISALNGQCWMIDTEMYRQLEPHRQYHDEVLEDVEIGRFLVRNGIVPVLTDLRGTLTVHMYPGFRSAWQGFQKNTYLLMGGSPGIFIPLHVAFWLMFVVAPILNPVFVGAFYLLKLMTDRYAGFPLWVTLCTPISVLLSIPLQIDSAVRHWTKRVQWKSRAVGR